MVSSAKLCVPFTPRNQMLGHLGKETMGSTVVPPRFVVHSEEALCRFKLVILAVIEGFFPPNQELNLV